MKHASILLLLSALSACAGPGAPTPSGGLAYRLPPEPSLLYVTGDTVRVDIEAPGMGSFQMEGVSQATLAMRFAPGQGGVQVTAAIQKLSARMSQPMGGLLTASESDIQGDLVFILDRKGKPTLVSAPQLRGSVAQIYHPVQVAYEFFPRLPGTAVAAGATWTDTIRYEVSIPEGTNASTTIARYSLKGDTVVDGMHLLKITYEGNTTGRGTGNAGGMEVVQLFAGDVNGIFLFDPARGVVVLHEASSRGSGTVDVQGAGIPPMPMQISGRQVARLQGG